MHKKRGAALVAACLQEHRARFALDAVVRARWSDAETERELDPSYLSHLPLAADASFDLVLKALVAEIGWTCSIPEEILTQARLAVAAEVPLHQILSRCSSANAAMTIYLLEAADRSGLNADEKSELVRKLGTVFEHVLGGVVTAYTAEVNSRTAGAQRRLNVARRLLEGDLIDSDVLRYDCNRHHVALVARSGETDEFLHDLASQLDARLLVLEPGESVRWAWLGTTCPLDRDQIRAEVAAVATRNAPVALSSSESGLDGWRAAHWQARSSYSVALRRGGVVHYEDVAIEVSALQDVILQEFLRTHYLEPITAGRPDGDGLVKTLRAYFSTARNGVAASAALGVSRQTVMNRLQAVEERLGQPLRSCAAALELAVSLDHLEREPSSHEITARR